MESKNGQVWVKPDDFLFLACALAPESTYGVDSGSFLDNVDAQFWLKSQGNTDVLQDFTTGGKLGERTQMCADL